MKGFLLMLSFFTRIPLGKVVVYDDEKYRKGLVTFPFVGMVIGFFLAMITFIPTLTNTHKAILILLTYLWVSGGIHLDGLADSADGLLSGRSKERILEIMKDSRIGSFGVIGLILYFLVFFVSVQSIDFKWLWLMPFVGKSYGLIIAGFSRYAREEQGMGFIFMHHLHQKHAVCIALINLMVCFLVLQWSGLIAWTCSFVLIGLVSRDVKKKINGHTGDTIGLMIEIGQMSFIFMGSILMTVI